MPSSKNGAAERNWVSLVPHGNAYKNMLSTLWENRDKLGYAWRIQRPQLLPPAGFIY